MQLIKMNANNSSEEITPLPNDYIPQGNDVICGRGRNCFVHSGNQCFRKSLQGRLIQYTKAKTKMEKSLIICMTVQEVRQKTPAGRFIRYNEVSKSYYEIGNHLAHEKTSQTFRDILSATLKSTSLKSCKSKSRQTRKILIKSCWKDKLITPEPSDSAFRGTTLQKVNSRSTCNHEHESQPNVAASIAAIPFFPNIIALLDSNDLTETEIHCDVEDIRCKSQQWRSSIVFEIPDYVLNGIKLPDTFVQDMKYIETHRSNEVNSFEINQETSQDMICKTKQRRSSIVYEIPDCVLNGIKLSDTFFQDMKYSESHRSNEVDVFEKNQETFSVHDNDFAFDTFFQGMEHSQVHISNNSNGLNENQVANQIHENMFFYDPFFQDTNHIQTHMSSNSQRLEKNKGTSPIRDSEVFSAEFLQDMTCTPTHRSNDSHALEKNKTSPISDNQYFSDTIFQDMNYTHTNRSKNSQGLENNQDTSPIDDDSIFSDDELLKVLGWMEFE